MRSCWACQAGEQTKTPANRVWGSEAGPAPHRGCTPSAVCAILPWLRAAVPLGWSFRFVFETEPLKGRRPEAGLSPPRCSVSGGSPFVPLSVLCVHKPDASSADRDDTRTACQPVTLGARRGVLSVIDMANGIVSHRNRTRPLGPTRITPSEGRLQLLGSEGHAPPAPTRPRACPLPETQCLHLWGGSCPPHRVAVRTTGGGV